MIRFLKIKGTRVNNVVKPCVDWWNFVEGDERAFSELQTLYHALSDPDAKVKSICLLSNHRVLFEAEREGVRAYFEVDVFLKNGQHDALHYVRAVIRLVKRKNKVMGRVLSGLWLHHIQEEEELEKLVGR